MKNLSDGQRCRVCFGKKDEKKLLWIALCCALFGFEN
jgi:hypothetical protein